MNWCTDFRVWNFRNWDGLLVKRGRYSRTSGGLGPHITFEQPKITIEMRLDFRRAFWQLYNYIFFCLKMLNYFIFLLFCNIIKYSKIRYFKYIFFFTSFKNIKCAGVYLAPEETIMFVKHVISVFSIQTRRMHEIQHWGPPIDNLYFSKNEYHTPPMMTYL